MRSDCVISWLCMHILTLTWENLISVNSSQFSWCFSVERPDGIPWIPDGCSMVVWTVFSGSPDIAVPRSPDRSCCTSELMCDVTIVRKGNLFCSDDLDRYARSQGPRVRTSWKLRPDGWPIGAINCPESAILYLIPHKINLLAFCE
jgi:hypothetical protein